MSEATPASPEPKPLKRGRGRPRGSIVSPVVPGLKPAVLRIRQMALYLGISESKVWRMSEPGGVLERRKIGNCTVITVRSADKLLGID
jgi:hypothetical protein